MSTMENDGKLLIYSLLDRMHLKLDTARVIPLYNRIAMDKEEWNDMLRQLEQSIPGDLKRAKDLLSQEEKILNTSHQEAEARVREAQGTAREITEKAGAQAQAALAEAQATLGDAQKRAADTVHGAESQAQAIMADANARASAILADAQARAQQMIADSEITARAEARAQEMLDATHHECEDYTMRVHAAMDQLLEHADAGLSQRLEELRLLRQDIAGNP